MRAQDVLKLLEDLEHELLSGARSVGILGLASVTLEILASLAPSGLASTVVAAYVPGGGAAQRNNLPLSVPVLPFAALSGDRHDVLVVAADDEKEDLLRAALPYIQNIPTVIVAGYGHLAFRGPVLRDELAQLLVPSLTNGYPHTLTHLCQCLCNAARLGLKGAVAEFGMFKDGTTMFLSRVIERLGAKWPVISFDILAS
jgi:O-methyltransferase